MPNRSFARKVLRAALGVCLLLLIAVSILYFRQHSMVYHPRPYDDSYAYAFPGDGVEINYTVSGAKYAAYYLPGATTLLELAREFPFVEFFAVENAGHASVLNHAYDKIVAWMDR
jgi:hypothetical protein